MPNHTKYCLSILYINNFTIHQRRTVPKSSTVCLILDHIKSTWWVPESYNDLTGYMNYKIKYHFHIPFFWISGLKSNLEHRPDSGRRIYLYTSMMVAHNLSGQAKSHTSSSWLGRKKRNKYLIYICFIDGSDTYLYPHDLV